MKIFSKRIQNEVVLLREFKTKDVDSIFELCTEEFSRLHDLKLLSTKLDTKTIIDYFINEDALAINDKQSKELVGFLRTYIENFKIFIDFGFSPLYDQNVLDAAIKLYVKEVVVPTNSKKNKSRKITSISIKVYENDVTSLEALERLGFSYVKDTTVGGKEKKIYELSLDQQ